MSLVNRPYAGTWAPNKKIITQWSPDALVYVNGDISISGCARCRHKINLQPFITSVSADGGIEPGAGSATIALSVPRHYGDSLFRDGNPLLRVGLEIHIYMKGYFPVTNLITGVEVDGVDLSDIPQYPYYPVFHGVVIDVSHEYSGGVYTASISCASMLHFWQYMNMSTSGSISGARPSNSGNRTTLTGHNFARMSPFSIIYTLYRDVAGAAGGVGFALSQTTSVANRNSQGETLYSLATRYWERRFAQGMYGLKMFGVSGRLFNAFEQAHFARGVRSSISSRVSSGGARPLDPFRIRLTDVALLPRGSETTAAVRADQMHAYVDDVSQWGSVNLFESTYESKLDVANQASLACGFEFYQDMDGDLVFKPPFYNLDTKPSRVYNLKPEDILSITTTEKEPEATYVTCRGSMFRNLTGLGLENEWGVQGVFVDYRLITQYGWRPQTMESAFYSDSRSAFYAAAARLAVLNAGIHSANVTVALRPEIKPGYPVYIQHIDCYYYVSAVSHQLQFGSGVPTTTLTLTARRRKFYAPGNPSVPGIEGIKLGETRLPPKPLEAVDENGIPKLVGFPNVVMALDPYAVDPIQYIYPTDTMLRSLISRDNDQAEVARNMLVRAALRLGLMSLDPNGGTQSFEGTNANTDDRFLQGPWIVRDGTFSGRPVDITSLGNSNDARSVASRERFEGYLSQWERSRNQNQTQRRTSQRDIRRRYRHSDPDDPQLSTGREPNSAPTTGGSGPVPGTQTQSLTLYDLFLAVRERYTQKRDFYGVNADGWIDTSVNLLDMLSSQKAAFSPHVPGDYRYYSCSHPDVLEQGPAIANVDMRGSLTFSQPHTVSQPVPRAVRPATGLTDPNATNYVRFESGRASAGLKVYTFFAVSSRDNPAATVDNPTPTTASRNDPGPLNFENDYVRDDEVNPVVPPTPGATTPPRARGGRRQRPRRQARAQAPARPTSPSGTPARDRLVDTDIVTTQDIHSMTFQVHEVRTPVSTRVPVLPDGNFPQPIDSVERVLREILAGNPGSTNPIELCSAMTNRGRLGSGNIKDENQAQLNLGNVIISGNVSANVPNMSVGASLMTTAEDQQALPDTGLGSLSVVTSESNGVTQTIGNVLDTVGYINRNIRDVSQQNLIINHKAASICAAISGYFSRRYQQILDAVRTRNNMAPGSRVQGTQLNASEIETVGDISTAWARCYQAIGVNPESSGRNKPAWRTVRRMETRRFSSPVFPVSDENGYEVIGSYQYGRGLTVGPDSNFQRLMSETDPLLAMSRDRNFTELVVQYVRSLTESTKTNTSTKSRMKALANSLVGTAVGDQIIAMTPQTQRSQDATMSIINGLMNVYANDRQVQTVPTNAAYSLAEIDPLRDVRTCACRGAEADLVLAAQMIGSSENSGFIDVEDADEAAVEFVKDQMVQASGPWSRHQRALRGTGDNGQNLLDVINTTANQLSQVPVTAASSLSELESESQALSNLVGAL